MRGISLDFTSGQPEAESGRGHCRKRNLFLSGKIKQKGSRGQQGKQRGEKIDRPAEDRIAARSRESPECEKEENRRK